MLLDLSAPPPDHLTQIFPVPVDIVSVEIGFGGGEHLLYRAAENPRCGFIGVEPFENGMAKAVLEIERRGLRNVRLYNDDAVLLLDWLPAGSLAGIDLLFPDPWPKTRHRKRRFVSGPNLDRITRCLAPSGVFRFASDVDAYAKWTLREVSRHGGVAACVQSVEAARKPWQGWPGTRYAAKAAAAGKSTTFLSFQRPG